VWGVDRNDSLSNGAVHAAVRDYAEPGVFENVSDLADVACDDERDVPGRELFIETGQRFGGGGVDRWHGLGVEDDRIDVVVDQVQDGGTDVVGIRVPETAFGTNDDDALPGLRRGDGSRRPRSV
jgi:hypothetical protein